MSTSNADVDMIVDMVVDMGMDMVKDTGLVVDMDMGI
jgi:hypothetical protein